MMLLVNSYHNLGKTEEAREHLHAIKNKFPDHYLAGQADIYEEKVLDGSVGD